MGLFFGLRGERTETDDIETVEGLSWSWSGALKIGGLGGGIAGLLFAFLRSFDVGEEIFLRDTSLRDVFLYTLIGGAIFGPMAALFGGLRSKVQSTKTVPNEGMRLSFKNTVFTGILFWFIGGLLISVGALIIGWGTFWVVGDVVFRELEAAVTQIEFMGLVWSFIKNGGFLGGLAALWYGGFVIIQHYTLRLILVLKGHTPRNYTHFLDFAVGRVFLQKVGGGYIFIHRLLLEHFAEMDSHKP